MPRNPASGQHPDSIPDARAVPLDLWTPPPLPDDGSPWIPPPNDEEFNADVLETGLV